MSSVAGVVDAAVHRLREAGFTADDARRDAVVIARGVLGWSLADWLSRSGEDPPSEFQQTFDPLVARRQAREPVAYLLGQKEFYGRPFRVSPDTLIPRPETEGLVDAALAWMRHHRERMTRPLRIVDVGTGTGCIAVTLARESDREPHPTIWATDISTGALDMARVNAGQLGARNIEFQHGHLLAGLPLPVDLIVSNPPYVAGRDRDTLPPDVGTFEPSQALFGGEDGLEVIRELVPAARRALAPGGALMMEIGAGQAAIVAALATAHGFAQVESRSDLQGIARVIIAS
jgi:release factor glutamine methyltransferase